MICGIHPMPWSFNFTFITPIFRWVSGHCSWHWANPTVLQLINIPQYIVAAMFPCWSVNIIAAPFCTRLAGKHLHVCGVTAMLPCFLSVHISRDEISIIDNWIPIFCHSNVKQPISSRHFTATPLLQCRSGVRSLDFPSHVLVFSCFSRTFWPTTTWNLQSPIYLGISTSSENTE